MNHKTELVFLKFDLENEKYQKSEMTCLCDPQALVIHKIPSSLNKDLNKVHLNWLNGFHFLVFVVGLLIILKVSHLGLTSGGGGGGGNFGQNGQKPHENYKLNIFGENSDGTWRDNSIFLVVGWDPLVAPSRGNLDSDR